MDLHAPSPLETLLARFWDDTLRIEASSRFTHFFSSGGGDSEARRLLTLVEDAFHLEIPLTMLHAAPTVSAFAEALKRQVDHPGRLERLAERLLHPRQRDAAAERVEHRAGASV